MSLPAATAAVESTPCQWSGTASITASISLRARTSSNSWYVLQSWLPYFLLMAWRAVSRWPASISQAATTWAPGSSKKLSTLLPPCQPVPMQATVMRSLGATTPSRPSARPGMKAGPSTAPVATFFRKSRRPIIQNLVTGGSDHWDAESRRDTISPAPRISSGKRSRIGGETPKPYCVGTSQAPFLPILSNYIMHLIIMCALGRFNGCVRLPGRRDAPCDHAANAESTVFLYREISSDYLDDAMRRAIMQPTRNRQ